MAIIIKKGAGESDQSVLNKFKRITLDDPALEKVREREMEGYKKPSAVKNVKNRVWAKERRRLRRQARRLRGDRKF
ncbi:hypothetical protein A2368_01755 [Candidatus Collierbacteria bacterium RIFOXYB1_FULL_49_13]|uniref:30S ribosomal protein S21 n=1 Tax=Candidatus Collierbacteria bacterium RIFOXYB1_FULL_49_13 TaxID=1817728 RepID=A0A1F5FIJ8_9BACT|nr:MAG: hypothetical protein A2368_01755 [Candidatus Collierbacteria bacterium RIFOXYB1_FULL_49_13]